jgi:hypothetical protein
MMQQYPVLSNDWINWFWSTYSIFVGVILPAALTFVLKLMAILKPTVQSDKIIDLLKEYWPGGIPAAPGPKLPGQK